MSLYADYIKEREGRDTLESDRGFATYFFIPQKNACFIADVYVRPEFRKTGHGSELMGAIEKIARERGCTLLYGAIDRRAGDPKASDKFLTQYGMRASGDRVDMGAIDLWVKEIK